MQLADVINAMSHLNSFARTERCRTMGYRFKPYLYEMKLIIMTDAIDAGVTLMARNNIVVKCRTCDGDGTKSWWRDPCRRCGGDGKNILSFIETRFRLDGVNAIWHTPIDEVWNLYIHLRHGDLPVNPTDWTPLRAGVDLTPQQLIQCLNVVENHCHGRLQYFRSVSSSYSIELSPVHDCGICGLSTHGTRFKDLIVRRGALFWRGAICNGCAGPWHREWWLPGGQPSSQQSYLPSAVTKMTRQHPLIISNPEVAAWTKRHPDPSPVFSESDIPF